MDSTITSDIERKNPKFANLLKMLRSRTTPDTNKEDAELLLAKTEYLKQKILYESVQHLLMKDNANSELSTVQTQFQLSECLDCLHIDNPFDLKPADVTSHVVLDQMKLKEEKELLASNVENHLCDVCMHLTRLHDLPNPPESPKVLYARAIQLGGLVREEKLESLKLGKRMGELRGMQEEAYLRLHHELHGCVDILSKIINKYTFTLQCEKTKILINDSVQSFETLAAKLRSIRVALLSETYTPHRVAALRNIFTEQENELKSRQQELDSITHQLEAYRKLGGEFEAVVREYTSKQDAIAKNKWSLEQVSKSMMI
uniref:Uncharacterized protein n=1 Tax=Ciona savignyi TaxID=51511 RepID=H2YIN8_CIOSA